MKWAEPRVIGARAFQLDVLTHHLDDIDASKQVVNKLLGDHDASVRAENCRAVGAANRYLASLAFNRAEAAPMSALPASWGLITAMTLPIS